MFLRLLSSLICNAQKLIKKYYGYNIKLIKKIKKKSNNILTDTERLDMKTVKTLFLCNRQQTNFYLFVTLDGKPFVTKDFSAALGISRVSFATEELLFSMLGTKIGATTVLSSIIDTENKVRIIFDIEVLKNEWYGCTDSTTTSYMKLKTADVLEKYIPFTKHEITVIEV